MKGLIAILRSAIGGLFIFSGLIKLNDPVGFSIKLTEYFEVFETPFMIPFALFLAVFICIVEVALGLTALLGIWRQLTAWGLLLMILFFTFLTFYSAYYNKVTDCGCFGDAIPLTPWESFTKDVILSVLIGALFILRRRIEPWIPTKMGISLVVVAIAGQAVFAYQMIAHLPLIDFRAYKVGTDIAEGMKTAEELGVEPPQFETYYTLRNASTGAEERISSKTYIDGEWWKKSDWAIISELTETVKVKEGYEPPIHDFSIQLEDEDITQEILKTDRVLMIIAYQTGKANKAAFEDINALIKKAEKQGYLILGLSATSPDEVLDFRHEVQAAFPFAFMDETTLKTIVRANPGIVMLQEGVVRGKWHYNDTPSAEELNALLQ